MAAIVLASIQIDEDDMALYVRDIQRVDHLPVRLKEIVKENTHGRRLNKSGLPSVLYLAPGGVQIIGAFTYGEFSFLEIEGKWTLISEGDELVCITAYRDGQTYEELVAGKKEYIEELKKKYPNGCTIE